MKFQTKRTGDFVLPDEGAYVLEFLGQRGEPRHWPAVGDKPENWSMMLAFKIVEDEDYPDEPEVHDFFPMEVTTGNKTGVLFAAMLGVPSSELPDQVDDDDLVGSLFRATYRHVTKDGKTYGKIESPLPMKRRRTASVDKPGF